MQYGVGECDARFGSEMRITQAIVLKKNIKQWYLIVDLVMKKEKE